MRRRTAIVAAVSLVACRRTWAQEPGKEGTAQVMAQAASLRAALGREVPQAFLDVPNPGQWVAGAIKSLGDIHMDAPQALVLVDRNPSVQMMVVAVAGLPEGWLLLGGQAVSTGKPGRKEHFKTPVGAFRNGSDILGYRALGTYNANHIRGNGTHGMRVWDFGWQETEAWMRRGEVTRIRLEMHATDPAVLEPRLGRPDSEGCVRLSSAMNLFIDRHGIIDADYEAAAVYDKRFKGLLRTDRTPTPLAGRYMVVFDSSMP